MKEDTLRTLEYEKILSMLAAEAGSFLGKEKAAALTPSSDFDEVEARLAETAEARDVLAVSSPPLGAIRDIRVVLKKAAMEATLEIEELSDVVSVLYATREAKKYFKELSPELAPTIRERARQLEILGQLENRLENAIDEHGALRDDASLTLAKLRRGIRAAQRKIKDVLSSVIHSTAQQKYLQDAIVTIREDRYVVPVKQEYRGAIPGIVHDQSATGATLFIEPMEVVSLNNEIKELTLSERQEVARILRGLSADIGRSADILQDNLEILAGLDFAFAKARLARKLRAAQPELNREGRVRIEKARHPLLADEKVVPIDLSLGGDFRMLLVTGPNTGGKTVSMKTLGLLALMAQSGLFIPAAVGAEMTVYREIFADIGDEQSIEQSLSTFSSHMGHIVRILDEAERDDLLLLDEIGAGTDPEEGAALAMAILERFLEIDVSTVATTHYSELKTFAYARKGVENACVEFDVETLRPTYRLLLGVPGASNAFAISARLGLAKSILLRAEALIREDHAQFEKVVGALEREKILYEERNAEIAERSARAKELEEKWRKLKDEVARKKTEILKAAKNESAALVRRTRREAEDIIQSLKEQAKEQNEKSRNAAMQDARGRLRDMADEVRPGFSSNPAYREKVDVAKLRVGDEVYIVSLDQRGTVLEVKGKEILVQVGVMKTTVKADACRFAARAKKETKEAERGARMAAGTLLTKTASVRREIDLRGCLVDEGEQLLAKFIDDAQLAGLKDILVIHGKGTGALRKGLHEYLKAHKSVRSFAIADMDEGGLGATVVKLK